MTDQCVVVVQRLQDTGRTKEILQGVAEEMRREVLRVNEDDRVYLSLQGDYAELRQHVVRQFEKQGPDWWEHWSVLNAQTD